MVSIYRYVQIKTAIAEFLVCLMNQTYGLGNHYSARDHCEALIPRYVTQQVKRESRKALDSVVIALFAAFAVVILITAVDVLIYKCFTKLEGYTSTNYFVTMPGHCHKSRVLKLVTIRVVAVLLCVIVKAFIEDLCVCRLRPTIDTLIHMAILQSASLLLTAWIALKRIYQVFEESCVNHWYITSEYDDTAFQSLWDKTCSEDVVNTARDLENLCIDRPSNKDCFLYGLCRDRDQRGGSLLRYAAENGLVLPMWKILTGGAFFMPKHTCGILSSPIKGTVLHSSIRSNNFPLVLLLIENISQRELEHILMFNCSTPFIHMVISDPDVEKYRYISEVDANEQKEFLTLPKMMHSSDTLAKKVLSMEMLHRAIDLQNDKFGLKNCQTQFLDNFWILWSSMLRQRSKRLVIESKIDFLEQITQNFTTEMREELYAMKTTSKKESPLHVAVLQNDLCMVLYLLFSMSCNASSQFTHLCDADKETKESNWRYNMVKATDIAGNTVLHVCKSADIMNAILDSIRWEDLSNVLSMRNTVGRTVFHYAIQSSDTESLQVLLKYMPALSKVKMLLIPDHSCMTVLDLAAINHQSCPSNLGLLLGHLDPQESFTLLRNKGNDGETTLHKTLKSHCTAVTIKALLCNLKVDDQLELLDVTDQYGFSPYDVARKSTGDCGASAWTLRHYAKLKTNYIIGRASLKEKRTLLRKLIRYGVDLSLEEIESLAPISETYIVPFNHTTTKPFAFVCYTTEDRPGSIEEAQTFMRALKQLGLSVYANCWGNIRELERGLSEKLEEVKHECSFLLLAIMSHGFTGHILGEDGSRGKLNTLISIVDNNLRKTVPIVIVIQACQRHQQSGYASYQEQQHIVLRRPHTVLLHATVPDGTALRGSYTGALAAQLSKASEAKEKMDINQAHTLAVNTMRSSGTNQKQVPMMQHTLEKFLVLPWEAPDP